MHKVQMQSKIQKFFKELEDKNRNFFVFSELFQDGNINCEKKRCARYACQNQKNSSKKQPVDEDCCQCRARRHQNNPRRKHKQEKNQLNLPKS